MKICDQAADYKYQASDKDTNNNQGYTKGHLFPASHASSKSDKMSTYTLTNSVPQVDTFNQGSWEKMEKCVKQILNTFCKNNNNVPEGYVVVGAQPSKNKLKDKINIPSMLWSAFCCYSEKKNMWLAGAHWGDNTAACTSKELQIKTLAELEQKLKIEVFPKSDCSRTSTVAEFKEINNCQCLSKPLTPSGPTTNQEQFIKFLKRSRTFCGICQNVLQGIVKRKGHPLENLRKLCEDLKNLKPKLQQVQELLSDERLKELVLERLKSEL